MAKVSVIIPVYNVAPYLRASLDGVLSQTCADWECVLVDDGSTDGSDAICDEYAARDARFVAVHQPNAGAGAARNVGMDRATGEYLFFFDPDDLIHPQWLSRLVEKAESEKSDVVLAPVLEYDLASRVMKIGYRSRFRRVGPYPRRPFAGRDFAELEFLKYFGVTIWDKLYRRGFVAENGIRFQEVRKFNDMCFAMECGFKAGRISTIRFPGCLYFASRKGSLQNSGISDELMREVVAECRRRIDGLHDGVWEPVVERYFAERKELGSAGGVRRLSLWSRFRKRLRERMDGMFVRRTWPDAFTVTVGR